MKKREDGSGTETEAPVFGGEGGVKGGKGKKAAGNRSSKEERERITFKREEER